VRVTLFAQPSMGGARVAPMEGVPTSRGRGARFWFIVVLAAFGVLFAAFNFQKVTID
jgi:hypothetical protein